ncbi:TIGR02452 family protein [Enterococcus cecorum]|nr:TIGR02452 family protein [Enterococcus cecorum]CAI3317561.1 TIGR02452 family protein [Enterococcus cecorum]
MNQFEATNKRIEIFEDTYHFYQQNPVLRQAVQESLAKQFFVPANQVLANDQQPQYDQDALIVLSDKRTFQAAMQYPDKKVAVLNFASATNPGGGVVGGSNAQEECLCRTSTLYANLTDREMMRAFYQPHRQQLRSGQMDFTYNDDLIYTPDVVIFKSDTAFPTTLPEHHWQKVDVITCAAPNLNYGRQMISPDELAQIHENRCRKILAVAQAQNVEVVILGAFGCGAFGNPPEIVAKGMMRAIQDFSKAFQTIEFAIYCPPYDQRNQIAFQKVLSQM